MGMRRAERPLAIGLACLLAWAPAGAAAVRPADWATAPPHHPTVRPATAPVAQSDAAAATASPQFRQVQHDLERIVVWLRTADRPAADADPAATARYAAAEHLRVCAAVLRHEGATCAERGLDAIALDVTLPAPVRYEPNREAAATDPGPPMRVSPEAFVATRSGPLPLGDEIAWPLRAAFFLARATFRAAATEFPGTIVSRSIADEPLDLYANEFAATTMLELIACSLAAAPDTNLDAVERQARAFVAVRRTAQEQIAAAGWPPYDETVLPGLGSFVDQLGPAPAADTVTAAAPASEVPPDISALLGPGPVTDGVRAADYPEPTAVPDPAPGVDWQPVQADLPAVAAAEDEAPAEGAADAQETTGPEASADANAKPPAQAASEASTGEAPDTTPDVPQAGTRSDAAEGGGEANEEEESRFELRLRVPSWLRFRNPFRRDEASDTPDAPADS